MSYAIDNSDGIDLFATFALDGVGDYSENVIYTTEKMNWFPYSQELLEDRNKSIALAWQCPKRKAKQGKNVSDKHQAKTPEEKAALRLKRSIAMKAAYANPELRAKASIKALEAHAKRRLRNGH